MKARILTECPEATLVDLTHQVLPQSIAEGSYYLQQSVNQFPKGTVFLAVVDPGVGSSRKAVAATAGDYFFVAPDNGLLSEVVSQLGGLEEAVELELPSEASNTFHGRDVFAPAAGKLAAGATLGSLGRTLPDLVASTGRTTIFREGQLEVTVLTVDHFGNVIFDFPARRGWEPLRAGNKFLVRGKRITFCSTYSRVLLGESLLLWNSSDYLELAVRNGNASKEWALKVGDRVVIEALS
jgi:S-adenosylmethionine hydrolase